MCRVSREQAERVFFINAKPERFKIFMEFSPNEREGHGNFIELAEGEETAANCVKGTGYTVDMGVR